MKEKIYTIPVSEAYEQTDCCPFCFLEKKLESDCVDYALGPSLMEPDGREESNSTGFCRHHLQLLYEKQNRLGLALILSTHMELIQKELEKISPPSEKGGFSMFKKKDGAPSFQGLQDCTTHCVICSKLDATLQRYIDVFFHLWKTEPEFTEKVRLSNGTCMRHGYSLLSQAPKFLSGRALTHFYELFLPVQKKAMERDRQELLAFIDLFDYRSTETDPTAHQSAVYDAMRRLRGE